MKELNTILYLILTWIITVHAGNSFYKNGRIYLLNMLDGNASLTDTINKLLLTGYYMINLGYVTIRLTFQEGIFTFSDLLEDLSSKTGNILIILAILHFFNLSVIYIYHRTLENKKQVHI